MSKNLFSFSKLRKLQRYSLDDEELLIAELDKEYYLSITVDVPDYPLQGIYIYKPNRFHHALARYTYLVSKLSAMHLHGRICLNLVCTSIPDNTRRIFKIEF